MSTAVKKSEQTRARILEGALTLFRRSGFEKATMRDIAKEAGVALGAAYYYFDSKDALVMAFYERTQAEMAPLVENALLHANGLEKRLHAVVNAKFQVFAPNRKLLGALSAHIDPEHPLSPFGENTRHIRERDIDFFSRAIAEEKVRIAADLQVHLPRILWLYQMGLLLFWIYDRSRGQATTMKLFEKSLAIVVTLIKLSSLPLMRPVRKLVTDLLELAYSGQAEGMEATP